MVSSGDYNVDDVCRHQWRCDLAVCRKKVRVCRIERHDFNCLGFVHHSNEVRLGEQNLVRFYSLRAYIEW